MIRIFLLLCALAAAAPAHAQRMPDCVQDHEFGQYPYMEICDQGLAFVYSLRALPAYDHTVPNNAPHKILWHEFGVPYRSYVIQARTQTNSGVTYFADHPGETGTEDPTKLYHPTRSCAARPRRINERSPPGGSELACFNGCEYRSNFAIGDDGSICGAGVSSCYYLDPTGDVCAAGNTSQPVDPTPTDPTDPEDPEEPTDPEDPDDPGGGGPGGPGGGDDGGGGDNGGGDGGSGGGTDLGELMDFLRGGGGDPDAPAVPWVAGDASPVEWSSGVSNGVCPAPYELTLTFFDRTAHMAFSLQPLCDFAWLIRSVLRAMALLASAYIMLGVMRR